MQQSTIQEAKALLSVKEFCHLAGIGRTTFYQQIQEGRIIAKKFGRRTLIPRSEFERFVSELPFIEPRSLLTY